VCRFVLSTGGSAAAATWVKYLDGILLSSHGGDQLLHEGVWDCVCGWGSCGGTHAKDLGKSGADIEEATKERG
jgi:hypothetical protein